MGVKTQACNGLFTLLSLLFCILSLTVFNVSNALFTGWTSQQRLSVTPFRWVTATLVPVMMAGSARDSKSLSTSGALLALMVGSILILANYIFFFSLLAFLVSSSRAIKYRAAVRNNSAGGEMGGLHVLCSCGIAVHLCLLYLLDVGSADLPIDFRHQYRASWFGCAILGSLSFSCGDTWAGQLGSVLSRGPTLLVTSLSQGTNGGVTLLGLLLSFLGGLLVGAAHYVGILLFASSLHLEAAPDQRNVILIGGLGGLLGSIIDSILGGSLKFRTVLDKNSVNLISNILTTLLLPGMAINLGLSMKDPGLVPYIQDVTGNIMEYTKGKANRAAELSTGLVLNFLSSILTIFLVITVSVFLWGTFYYAYVPIDVYKMPLDLQFEPCEESRLKCSYPSGQLTLGRKVKLNQGQSYSISSRLELPDNTINEEHGMFMTCLTISSAKGVQLDQSCKSSILQYRSTLLRVLETLTFLPALITGVTSQKQEIVIDFFENFELDPHNPGEVLTLEIRSKHLQLSEAALDIYADLRGLKLLMYRHPWVSMVIGIGTNILLLTSIILMSWSRFLAPGSLTGRSSTESGDFSQVEEVGTEDLSPDRLFVLKTIFVALIMIILLISGSVY